MKWSVSVHFCISPPELDQFAALVLNMLNHDSYNRSVFLNSNHLVKGEL